MTWNRGLNQREGSNMIKDTQNAARVVSSASGGFESADSFCPLFQVHPSDSHQSEVEKRWRFIMFGNSAPFSYSPGGFSQEDFPQQRRAFQQDEPKEDLLQRNGISRPSGRSIYMQRKEYSEVLNRQPERFQVRVEHLFTCELDGQEVKTVDDCVSKLMKLDAKGRLWPQEMIMEAAGGSLLLCDIETKAQLEAMPLSSIVQTRAVLDSCAYNSLLTVTVQERSKRFPQVFMFQCEETRAELIKADVDMAVQRGGSDTDPRREPTGISRHNPGSFRQGVPVQQEGMLPPPDYAAPQGIDREPNPMPPQRSYSSQEEMVHSSTVKQNSPKMALDRSDIGVKTDILNHVINDLEIFVAKVSASANTPSLPENGGKKKSGSKKNKSKINAPPAFSLPHWDEYTSCLQKIKYGLNLLAQLSRVLTSPSAPEFVHIFFTNLSIIVPRYPPDLPPTVVAPLLTPEALNLLSQTLSPEEIHLWKSLGDCWAVPRSGWPDNVPPYMPEFYDGWQPPPPSHPPPELLPPPPPASAPISRSYSQRQSQIYSPRAMQQQQPELVANGPWSPAPHAHPTEPPLYMHVMYSFTARNSQELTVMKGETVQVVHKSRPWWLVRNSRNEEGNVPPNVLEPIDNVRSTEDQPFPSQRNSRGPVTLDMSSSPAEVRAWLEYRGFSRITVSSLGVLTGRQLLGMSKDDIRTVCPEEAGKVFFQLQGIKSSLALASEPSGMYNSHY
uniref:EPS8-like 3 n=3 Tax=Nothobranchius TaxID=28779 RepID=A0A1A8A457_NOTFU